MDEISEIARRVDNTGTLPGLLDASFAAFEAIRLTARAYEHRAPELFAAFMMAAGTAVEGRNALNDAPSLPLTPADPPPAPVSVPATGVACTADQLAALAALVANRLRAAIGPASLSADRAACQHGAQAAEEIRRLLGSDHDETTAR